MFDVLRHTLVNACSCLLKKAFVRQIWAAFLR